MNPEQIQKMIKLAHEIVKDEKESFKIVTFQTVLQYLLQNTIPYSEKGGKNDPRSNEVKEKGGGIDSSDIDIENRMKKLAEKCEIKIDELKDTLSIKNGELQLLYPIKGTESEKQVKASQCILTGFDELLGLEWVKSTILKECLRNSGIQDKNSHLAENLKNKESVFRLRGSKLGTEYKLTGSGKIEALKIIKQLSVGE